MQVSNKSSRKTLQILILLLILAALAAYLSKNYMSKDPELGHSLQTKISLNDRSAKNIDEQHDASNQPAAIDAVQSDAERTKAKLDLQGQELMQVKQAYFLTQLAQDRLRYAHDYPAAKQFLRAAQDQLTSFNDPALVSIKNALAQDENKLNAEAGLDLDQLQAKFSVLEQQLPTLSTKQQLVTQTKPQQNQNAPQPTHMEPGIKGYINNLLSYFKSMIKVRKQADPDLGVLSLNEQISRSQLKLQIEQMRWACFYQDNEVLQQSIKRAQDTLNAVFANTNPSTQKFAQELDDLAKIKLHPEVPNLQDTLQAFHTLLIG